MNKTLLFILSVIITLHSFAQDTGDEYYKLKKKSKKPNITHVALDLGLGMNNMNKLRQHEVGTTTFNNQTVPDNSYSSDQDHGLPMGVAALHADFIETNKTYFGVGGYFSYAFGNSKVGSKSPDAKGNTLYEKGKTTATNYEVLAKFGIGVAKFKVYFGAGIGNISIKYAGEGNSSMTVNNVVFKSVFKDSITYDLGYQKVAIGFRIGSNRKKVVDIAFYKLLMGKDFFFKTDNPGILKQISSFGKYEDQYPALAAGVSACYTITGKYKFEADIRFFRDYDFVDTNASAFSFAISKQFDFHNHKKK